LHQAQDVVRHRGWGDQDEVGILTPRSVDGIGEHGHASRTKMGDTREVDGQICGA